MLKCTTVQADKMECNVHFNIRSLVMKAAECVIQPYLAVLLYQHLVYAFSDLSNLVKDICPSMFVGIVVSKAISLHEAFSQTRP